LIRAVLDANVFISGLLSQSGPPAQILDAWTNNRFTLFVSKPIVAEIQRVLAYPRIHNRLQPGSTDQLLSKMGELCEWAAGDLVLDILKQDPTDNIYLACAIEARANFLVTGNLAHFLEIGDRYYGIRLISPREFVEILSARE
jgi:putative PIN family toxin of toxin-antitoxin system